MTTCIAGGLDDGQGVGLFQAREQLLCATKNDHRLCLVQSTGSMRVADEVQGGRLEPLMPN